MAGVDGDSRKRIEAGGGAEEGGVPRGDEDAAGVGVEAGEDGVADGGILGRGEGGESQEEGEGCHFPLVRLGPLLRT